MGGNWTAIRKDERKGIWTWRNRRRVDGRVERKKKGMAGRRNAAREMKMGYEKQTGPKYGVNLKK